MNFKPYDNKKFNQEGVIEFELFCEYLIPEADKRKCKKHFIWKPEDVLPDKSVPEEEFTEVRICPVGEEAEHVRTEEEARKERLRNKYERQKERLLEGGYEANALKRKQNELLNELEDELEEITSSHAKRLHDTKADGDQYDKRLREFNEDRANAVALLRTCLGPHSMNVVYKTLNEVGPKNALKKIADVYDSEADTSIFLNSVIGRMANLSFSFSAIGNAADHMAFLDRENSVLLKKDLGCKDAQLLNYLIDAMKRSSEAMAVYKGVIQMIVYLRRNRTEAMGMFLDAEQERAIKAETSGQKGNHAGAKMQYAHNVTRTGKRSAKGGGGQPGKKKQKTDSNWKPYCFKCGGEHLKSDCEVNVYCKTCKSNEHSEKVCFVLHPELRPKWLKDPSKKKKDKKVPSEVFAEDECDNPDTILACLADADTVSGEGVLSLDGEEPEMGVVAALGTRSVAQNGPSMTSIGIEEGVATFNVTVDRELLQRIHTTTCENCAYSFWMSDASTRQYYAFACTARGGYFLKVIVDSGASIHMLPEREMFTGPVRPTGGKVALGNESYKLEIEGVGETRLSFLGSVLLVPRLSLGLLSVSQLAKAGYRTVFENRSCEVMDVITGEVMLTASLIRSNLYVVDRHYMDVLIGTVERADMEDELAAAAMEDIDLMHRRHGHVSESTLKRGLKNGSWKGTEFTYEQLKKKHLSFCPACYEGQMKASPRGEVSDKQFEVGEKFGVDYKGKFRVTSVDGYNGFYLMCDYASDYLFLFLVKSKDEQTTTQVLEEFYLKLQVLSKNAKPPGVMQCDYDTVLQSSGIVQWLRERKIKLQMSAPYTHWQNGKIERSIGKVMDTARTLMADGRVPHRFWSYAVRCAVYQLNRRPVKKRDETPVQTLTGEVPDASFFVPFWCSGVYHKTKEERNGPWDLKAVRVRMVGYHEETKNSYYVYEVGTNKAVKVRHDCVWDESSLTGEMGLDNLEGDLGDDDLAALEEALENPTPEETQEEREDLSAFECDPRYESDPGDEHPYWALRAEVEDWIDDVNERAFLAEHPEVAPLVQPKSLEEALNHPTEGEFWRAAYETEINNFESREVFASADQRGPTMKTKIILKKMRKPDGSIKYKIRLVAKGFSQIKGVNYNETYAPTTSTEVVLVSMQMAVIAGYKLSSFDVTAAFLEGKNDYPNFARLPEGFGKLGGQRVRVVGNFYGEKQGPKIWNDKLHEIMIKGEFERCAAHPCLYRRCRGSDSIYSCIHVDDGLVATNQNELTEELKKVLLSEVRQATFEKEVKKYIGIDVHWDEKKKCLKLTHEQYITENWGTVRGESKTPMCPSHNLRIAEPVVSDDTMLHDTGKFRFACDRARPDILVATGEIATGGDKNPSELHKRVAQKTKEYLYHTRTLGLEFRPGELFIFGYCDAAYITVGNCKSRLGGCIFLNLFSGAVRSFSKTDTQPSSVSHSSTEAEIKAIDEWCRELLHILDIVSFLIGRRYEQSVLLLVDNQSAIQLCTTLKQNHKVKHINVRITFIRELVLAGVVRICHVDTENNSSDTYTKPLDEGTYCKHRKTNLHGHDGQLPPHKALN